MRRWLFRTLAFLALLVLLGTLLGRWVIERQGRATATEVSPTPAAVSFDGFGVATLRGGDMATLAEAQGYLTASERLFQMDLSRRFGSGRLAELFGAKALELDRSRRVEDWPGHVERAYQALPPEQREVTEAYAAGVNRFIQDHADRWGLEYTLLRQAPAPWRGADSLFVLMAMLDQLTSSSKNDALTGQWRTALPPAWGAFLFTMDHPWNEPMFGTPERKGPVLPTGSMLPMSPLLPAEGEPPPLAQQSRDAGWLAAAGTPASEEAEVTGSNSFAYCGRRGCFLANDPHLGFSVPQVWYAVRLERAQELGVTGVSLPGIPGVTIGMNTHLAWAFTNVGEDVDDLLVETLSPDGARYLAAVEGGVEIWAPIRTVTSTIQVMGAAPVQVSARLTRRGPLLPCPTVAEAAVCSRRWLAFEPGILRMPVGLPRARSWDELNLALDQLTIPAQNVLMVDRQGGMGYRASGTGIRRRVDGTVPQPAITGDWEGLEPSALRPRTWLPASSTTARFLATSNERIWVSPFGHSWADDARKDRVRTVLGANADLGLDDLLRLQLDTVSRFHHQLLSWILARTKPTTPAEAERTERWKRFDGNTQKEPQTFGEAMVIEAALGRILIGRVRQHLLPEELRWLPYNHRLMRAWVLVTLETEGGTRVFGVEEGELARRLLAIAAAVPATPTYAEQNRWAAQHPFADQVPVLGKLFAISTPPQVGSRHVPRVETPKFGASMRLVFSLFAPEESRWSFPVGQSGHVGSPHYDDARVDWVADRAHPMFPPVAPLGRLGDSR